LIWIQKIGSKNLEKKMFKFLSLWKIMVFPP
jgi:hypothetical protein